MYAIIKACGRQYRVAEGDIVFFEKLDQEADSQVEFTEILAVGTDSGAKLGDPFVPGAKVTGKVIKNGKSKKITVFTYRAKKNSKRKLGHRQLYTKVQIESIQA